MAGSLAVLLSLAALAGAEPRWSKERARQAGRASSPGSSAATSFPAPPSTSSRCGRPTPSTPPTIDRELGFAESVGMNVVRVFLHNLAWEEDAAGLKQRIGRFLELADKHHIRTMFVLFDSCWNDHPKAGKQPAPKPGVHNSGWIRAPGTDAPVRRPHLGRRSRATRRTSSAPSAAIRACWRGTSSTSRPTRATWTRWFRCSRRSSPGRARRTRTSRSPSGLWNDHPLSNDVMLDNSDVVTFHDYDAPDKLEAHIQRLAEDRPPAHLHRVHGAHARQPLRDVAAGLQAATASARSTGVS